MKYLVTGGAGFIGSNLVSRLIENDNEVIVFDNFSSGDKNFLKEVEKKEKLKIIEGDLLLERKLLEKATGEGVDCVFHLAANPDIRAGIINTKIDLEQGALVTFNVLEYMRKNNVKKIVFSSSSVVYGEAQIIPTPEDYGPLIPISLYGASKLAAEGLITSYCHTFNMQCWIFRFANIVGKHDTHGILVDFMNKLKSNPKELEILGDGKQKKSYLLVEECIDVMLYAIEKSNEKVNIFNLGCGDQITVTEIAKMVVDELGLRGVVFRYTGGKRGWKGDVPVMLLDAKKINQLGWKAKYNSREAIKIAIRSLIDEWQFQK